MKKESLFLLIVFFLTGGLPLKAPAKEAPAVKNGSGSSADQTDNNYYWQGTQLYNLAGSARPSKALEKSHPAQTELQGIRGLSASNPAGDRQ